MSKRREKISFIAEKKVSKPVKVDKIIAKAAAGPLEDQQMPDSDYSVITPLLFITVPDSAFPCHKLQIFLYFEI